MELTTAEKIKLLAKRKGVTLGDIAESAGHSRQNLSNKLARNNFNESELRDIAAALNCKLKIEFIPNDEVE